jgi:exopolyphosphatase/pppGpp-phosphohydrolase
MDHHHTNCEVDIVKEIQETINFLQERADRHHRTAEHLFMQLRKEQAAIEDRKAHEYETYAQKLRGVTL